MDDEEIWRELGKLEIADVFEAAIVAPKVDMVFPEHLDFTFEQREFMTEFVTRVVEAVTTTLGRNWARTTVEIMALGKWQTPPEWLTDETDDTPD